MIGALILLSILLAFYFGGKKTREWAAPAQPRHTLVPTAALPTPEEWYKTHALFAKTYPPSSDHAHELELQTRLEQLQQLPHTNGAQSPADWNFYKFVLENPQEQWIVQRQALKNINGRLPAHSEYGRAQLLGKIDKRALATWQMSDSELALFLMGANHNEH